MVFERLGECEVCKEQQAKYTCPGCEVKTCSLACVNSHKQNLNCDGMRNKTAYKPLSKFTNMDLLSDYRLLEDVSQSVDGFIRNPKKNLTRLHNLPLKLSKLMTEARKRNMYVWFLPSHFSKHKENTTFLNFKTSVIEWRVQWNFPDGEKQKSFVLERMVESLLVGQSLQKIIAEENGFDSYRSVGMEGITVLLAAENVRQAGKRYFEMDLSKSLEDNLKGHTIVEFPTFIVILKTNKKNYTVISLDDVVAERQEMKRQFQSSSEDNGNPSTDNPKISEVCEGFVNETKRPKIMIPSYSDLCSANTSKTSAV